MNTLKPIHIPLKPSWLLTALFILLACICLVAILASALPVWFKLILALLVLGISLNIIYRHTLRRSKQSIIAVRWQQECWTLQLQSKQWLNAELLDNSFLQSNLSILNFKVDTQRRPLSVLITTESCPPRALQTLLMYLKK